MELINFGLINEQISVLKSQWNDPRKPFHYLIFDNFFADESAEWILKEYPDLREGEWDTGTTYINQNNKYTLSKLGDRFPVIQQAFDELNGSKFLKIIEDITGIEHLIVDHQLFGGGLHQSQNGAFLDVHVDFNFHQKTRHHRRINVIIFMNRNWKEEYNGFLEIWDMSAKKQVEYIKPAFNRCVILETNEVSYHGHPKPLKTPKGIARRSLAVYYYTKERPEKEIAHEHNTIYVNTEGFRGRTKNFVSGVKAFIERILK